MTTRRSFLRTSALLGGALGSGLAPGLLDASTSSRERARAPRSAGSSLRVLVLGGTGFIGPHLVRRLLERGHVPTLFNRGRTEPRLFPEIFTGLENLVGDRNGDVSALEGGDWDAVIDNSGYTPDQVRLTARLLRGSAGRYLFTSTRGVYAGYTAPEMTEEAPVGIAGLPEEEWTGYGPLKALAEREVRDAFPDHAGIVRPPIITGPGDSTDRFTYWYVRVDRGGEVLAPGAPDDPVQYIDVRDLADFLVHLAEEGTSGTFNTTGPAAPLSSAGFLHGVRAVTPAPVRFSWVDWDELEARGVRVGRELSAWRPPRGDDLNYGRMDNRRALDAGIRFRPLAETAGDTLAWWKETVGATGGTLDAGIPPELEAAALGTGDPGG